MTKISIKTDEEIKIMAEGGRILNSILEEVLKIIKPGFSTKEIDNLIENRILKSGGQPSFKFVPRYHWASCVGLNNEVVHSIPSKDKVIKEGDLVKIDLGMLWKGFNTDLSWTVEVHVEKGELRHEKFVEAGERALKKAISVAVAGNRVGHISQAIQEVVEGAGYSPVKILTGHGIGLKLHEEPMIPCFINKPIKDTLELVPGMTLAIEVIYAQKSSEVVLEDDGWTISTKDGKISGLFERTIAVQESSPLVLT